LELKISIENNSLMVIVWTTYEESCITFLKLRYKKKSFLVLLTTKFSIFLNFLFGFSDYKNKYYAI